MSVVGETRAQTPIDVRAAGPKDLGPLVAVSLAAARSDLGWAGRDWMPPDAGTARQIWWDRLCEDRAWVGVAVVGFTRVGCATAWPAPTLQGRAPEVAYLVGPIVDPEWWGEGIGTALLDESLAVLARLRFARAEVAIPAGNRHGRRFLERRGWTQAEPAGRRSPMALMLYALDVGQAPIENRSQYAA